MTTMLDLPDDVLDEILSRVPVDSTRTVRSTCRAWNDSFYRRFAKTMEHSVKATSEEATELGESRMIMMMDHNVYLTSVVLNENPSAKRLGKLTCLTHEQVNISQVFHCDGLLLCILKDDKRLVVWNPCLGETRWIEERQDAIVHAKYYKYALGYEEDSCRRHYKILRFTDATTIRGFLSYETYDFDSSSWTHQRCNAFRDRYKFCDRGVSLKGNTYWCAINSWGLISNFVCFDFTRMRFGGRLYLPTAASNWSQDLVSLSCVRDEKLSVLIQPRETLVLDIWISYKIDEQKVLWREFMRVDMGPLTSLIRTDGVFFVEEEKKLAMVFSKDRDEKSDTVKVFGEDGYLRELDLGEPSNRECRPLLCPYVPSFVQIKPHKSSSEKHLYVGTC